MKVPKEITVCSLEVIVMPNGEIICAGQSIGWVEGPRGLSKYLSPKEAAARPCKKRHVTAVTARCSYCGSYCDDIQFEYEGEQP